MIWAPVAAILVTQFAFAAPAPRRAGLSYADKVENSDDVAPVGPNASGPRVTRAQILLDRARFSPGEIDGQYGDALRIAITGYQEKHGMKPNGVIDAEMWKLL